MKSDFSRLLEKLTTNKRTREMRSLDLLKSPNGDKPEDDWFVYLPPCFNDALDIRQTERKVDGKKVMRWTQGTFFSFKAGDKIYDTPQAYQQWSDALQHTDICILVQQATDVSLSEDGKSRFPGSVTFSICKPDKQRKNLVEQERRTFTQDEFVRFLITGQ